MVDVSSQIIISRPAEIVSAYAANPDNAPDWYVNIKAVEWKTAKPLRLGTQVSFKANFLGRQLAYTYEIMAFEPGKKLVMRTAEGPFPMETSYTWQPLATGDTKMILRNRGTPSGFSRLLSPFMALAMKKANNKDLKRLKQILENPGL